MRQKNATGIRNGKTRGTRGNQDNHTPGDLQTGQFDHRGNGKEEKKLFRTSQTPGFAFAGQMFALCLHCGCLHLRVLVVYLQMLVLMGSASPAQSLTSRDNIADIIRQLRALLRHNYPTGPAVFARRRAAPLASALPKSTLIAHALIAQA